VEGSSCEHGNEPSGSIKGGELLDWLSDCQLLRILLCGVSKTLPPSRTEIKNAWSYTSNPPYVFMA
jgi:hypothetical protein